MSVIYTTLSQCYHSCVPSFIVDQVDKIKSEFIYCLEKPYVGGSSYRFKGEGDPYLKTKSIYIAPNPWDLIKSLSIYTIIGAVGYLIASVGAVWIGYGILAGAAYFALAEAKEYWGGNHLAKALNAISPLDTLSVIDWTYAANTNKITIDPPKMTKNVMRGLGKDKTTQIVLFKLPPPAGTPYKKLIKIYYIGKDMFMRSLETKHGIRLDCNNLLRGEEIQSLLTAANSPKLKN